MLSEVDVARDRFEALFREHVAGIASYCRWCLRSRGDAEDAVAEVFLVAWRRLDDVPAGEASTVAVRHRATRRGERGSRGRSPEQAEGEAERSAGGDRAG